MSALYRMSLDSSKDRTGLCFAITESPVKVRLNSRLSHYARVALQLGQSFHLARFRKASLNKLA